MRKRKFILAITAASGSIYARLTLNALLQDKTIDEIVVIMSSSAPDVMSYEGESLDLSDKRITLADNKDFFSPSASGTSGFEAMIIVPCSTGSMARIASGVCTDLISRSADVMLKESRRLIIALRESPLSLIHLNNMTLLTQAGAMIMPLSPAFYPRVSSVEELCEVFACRLAQSAGAEIDSYEWKGK